MKNKSGIVMKVTKRNIVLLMPDGSFKNVSRKKEQVPFIGERFHLDSSVGMFPRTGIISIAAAVCLFLLAAFTYNKFTIGNSQPEYLVALDINPSVEIYLDKNAITKDVIALNRDAEIFKPDKLKGKTLAETIQSIIGNSVSSGYLSPNMNNFIMVASISLNKAGQLEENKISGAIENALQNRSIKADVKINSLDINSMKEAHNLGLSVNRYMLYNSLIKESLPVTIEEARTMPLGDLENYKKPMSEPVNENKESKRNKENEAEKTPVVNIPEASHSIGDDVKKEESKTAQPTSRNKTQEKATTPKPIEQGKNNPINTPKCEPKTVTPSNEPVKDKNPDRASYPVTDSSKPDSSGSGSSNSSSPSLGSSNSSSSSSGSSNSSSPSLGSSNSSSSSSGSANSSSSRSSSSGSASSASSSSASSSSGSGHKR